MHSQLTYLITTQRHAELMRAAERARLVANSRGHRRERGATIVDGVRTRLASSPTGEATRGWIHQLSAARRG